MTIKYSEFPDNRGHFGQFGGVFASETLMHCLEELNTAYRKLKTDPDFLAQFQSDLADYVGRPSPLYLAERLTAESGGAKIWLKREDLNHTGAHKINNTVGQILLAKAMGKKRIIAETGAGQHGVATATVCARMGLKCVIYMGEVDIARQAINVYRMKLMGAEVRSVDSGSKTLKDALNEAMRDKSLQQAVNAATLPGLVGNVLVMPDMHQGYGFPIYIERIDNNAYLTDVDF